MSDIEFRNGISGKVVDRVVVNTEEGIELEVRFQDSTSFNISLEIGKAQVIGADLLVWKEGNSRVVKKFNVTNKRRKKWQKGNVSSKRSQGR